MKKPIIVAVLLLVAASAAQGAVVYTNLGTSAPPATLGGLTVTPYDQAPQAAIADSADVTVIPGGPGTTSFGAPVSKRTIGSSWGTWSHGYTGVIYFSTQTTAVLSLPPGTAAFYFYAEPDAFAILNITATTDAGTSSGPIAVNGSSGATGFGFHTTAGESIVSISITTDDQTGMGIGEFGAATGGVVAIPTASPYGLAALALAIVAAGFFLLKGKLLA